MSIRGEASWLLFDALLASRFLEAACPETKQRVVGARTRQSWDDAGTTHGDGRLLRSAELIPTMDASPEVGRPGENTTLVCGCTDASFDKRGCGIIARTASAGVARAVDPVFGPIDGDVVFCVASGSELPPAPGLAASWALTALGTVAATVTARAIRDAVAASRPAQPRAV